MIWWGLFKKEWKESQTRFFIGISLLSLIFVFMFFMMERNSPFFFFLGFAVIGVHAFYLFAAWLVSFVREWRDKTHYTWLNLPVSGWVLLSSKLAAGFSQFVLSLIFSMIAADLMLSRALSLTFTEGSAFAESAPVLEIFQELYRDFSPWIFMGIAHGSAQLGLAVVFIFLASKIIRPLGWLAGIVIVIGWGILVSFIQELGVYSMVTQFGMLLNANALIENALRPLGDANFELAVEEGAALYTGDILFHGLIYLFLFWLFSYLIDNYVEA
ncbi:hypothetical protein [Alkalicoccus halolimnae]|uniref:Uncharacterized protein n=1 Tax=Alkalicoccus halolimnae TaxID=1667239 RepID=A0A5C7FBZ4_9BACI|nr:hypothetical protein [Alkalicoccus halolimnae]TXF81972.1 hypothetical protein FTX54_15240 [Alkalicoccus halolimnae]